MSQSTAITIKQNLRTVINQKFCICSMNEPEEVYIKP